MRNCPFSYFCCWHATPTGSNFSISRHPAFLNLPGSIIPPVPISSPRFPAPEITQRSLIPNFTKFPTISPYSASCWVRISFFHRVSPSGNWNLSPSMPALNIRRLPKESIHTGIAGCAQADLGYPGSWSLWLMDHFQAGVLGTPQTGRSPGVMGGVD